MHMFMNADTPIEARDEIVRYLQFRLKSLSAQARTTASRSQQNYYRGAIKELEALINDLENIEIRPTRRPS